MQWQIMGIGTQPKTKHFETAIDKNRLALIEADTVPIDAGLGDIEPDH